MIFDQTQIGFAALIVSIVTLVFFMLDRGRYIFRKFSGTIEQGNDIYLDYVDKSPVIVIPFAFINYGEKPGILHGIKIVFTNDTIGASYDHEFIPFRYSDNLGLYTGTRTGYEETPVMSVIGGVGLMPLGTGSNGNNVLQRFVYFKPEISDFVTKPGNYKLLVKYTWNPIKKKNTSNEKNIDDLDKWETLPDSATFMLSKNEIDLWVSEKAIIHINGRDSVSKKYLHKDIKRKTSQKSLSR